MAVNEDVFCEHHWLPYVLNVCASMAESKGKFDFAIDRGGTFTDVFARLPDGKERVLKLLSHDPQNYRDAPTEGIRRVLEEVRENTATPNTGVKELFLNIVCLIYWTGKWAELSSGSAFGLLSDWLDSDGHHSGD